MRIRNSRNPIDVLAAVCSSRSSLLVPPPLCSMEKPRAAAPEVGVCLVNQSPWDVTPLVLAFFHVDAGLLHHHHSDDDCNRQKDLAQEATASKERTGGSRSDPLSPSISPFKAAGKDGRKGKGKQEEKRSEALCFKPEGWAPEPTTIRRSLQNSKRRAARKGEEEGLAAAKDGRSGGAKDRTCKREDGKGWRCSNEAAPGSTLCEHHLSQVRSYCKRPSTDSRDGAGKLLPSTRAGGGEGRRRRSMSISSSSMGSFYYYTGFGPAWRETKRKRVSAVAEDDDHSHTVEEEEDEDDEEEADDGDGDEDGGKGKSRGRKRVKCRSLKSLL